MNKPLPPRRKTPPICYMCGDPAVGRDHVVPECFFPPIAIFRKNLLTLPACKAHNADLSKDDEYVATVLVFDSQANRVATGLYETVWRRRMQHRPAMLERLLAGARDIKRGDVPSVLATVDRRRVDRVLTRIAAGIYFHRTKRRLENQRLWWYCPSSKLRDTLEPDPKALHANALFSRMTKSMKDELYEGSVGHPRVFRYQLISKDETSAGVRFAFYDGMIFVGVPARS